MKLREALKTSIKTRLIVGMVAMLLPFLIYIGTTYIGFQNLLFSFANVTNQTIAEARTNTDIQMRLLEVKNTVDNYVVTGEPDSYKVFDRQANYVNLAIRELKQVHYYHPSMKSKAVKAAREWQREEKMSRTVLSIPDPKNSAKARRLRFRIDNDIDRTRGLLTELHVNALKEINDALESAKAERQRGIILVAFSSVLGVAIAIFAGSWLSRSIIMPLDKLGEGVHRLGAGELAARVDLSSEDEMGRLGQAFNLMAQRLQIDQAALEELSTHDSLTGLFNRRVLFKILNEEIERSKRYGFGFSLLIVDIDHFKAVNDSYGHRAGDIVLREISCRIIDAVRPIDKTSRYGGEEFVVILPQTKSYGARVAAERLRYIIGSRPIRMDCDQSTRLTVSVGIAVFPDDAQNDEGLISLADEALYIAKSAGRNTVRRYGEGKKKRTA